MIIFRQDSFRVTFNFNGCVESGPFFGYTLQRIHLIGRENSCGGDIFGSERIRRLTKQIRERKTCFKFEVKRNFNRRAFYSEGKQRNQGNPNAATVTCRKV